MSLISWSDFTTQVKQATDFPSLLEELTHTALPRQPQGGRAVMVRCPWHDDRDPSLAIYEDGAHCYGACARSWDAFALVEQALGLDFKGARDYLAERARIPRPAPDPESERRAAQQRAVGDLLDRAATYYRQQFWSTVGIPGQVYAHGRGWSPPDLRAEGLGYSDGRLWKHLQEQGLDLAPAHQAGLLRRDGGGSYSDAIPTGYLVYVHERRGRVDYLAGRAVDSDDPARKCRNLLNVDGHTPKRPYYNALARGRLANLDLAIVEGQADAVTLATWGQPAVALAGCSLADADARDLGPARRLLIALDHDATGQAQTRDLILRLGPQARVVTWPAKDANAWAQAGAGASEAANLLTSAPDAVQWLLDAIPPDVPSTDLSQHLEPLLDLLTQLDPMTAQAHLRAIKGRFQLTMDVFRGLEKNLAAARRSQTAPPTALAGEVLTSPYYEDRAGELWYIDPSRPWPQNEHRVAAFSARIVAERLVDDGAECVTWFDLAGELRHGRGFEISIPAATFADPQRLETALLDAVGSAAVIEPRRGAYFKRAVQYLSPAPARREVFSHTGWRTFGERRVFLTAGGALGYPDSDICVDLDGSLNRYTLPLEPQDPGAALRASLRTLDLAADQVTFPLWAGMFLAPLGEWLRLDFTLWPYGPTGCLKSTLSALFLAHYGAFSRTMLPGNWASTANALERLAFLAKDVPLIIDDFAPQNQGRDATEIERKAERLIRGAGNRQGRQRLRSDLRARPEYYPRGLLISNGEQLPSGQSIMARVLGLEMDANGIDLAQLGAAQAEADCYPHALAGYILWLADQWSDLTIHLPAAWRDARSQVHAYHLRVPEVYASLYVALDLALQYAEHAGAVTPALGRELLARGDAALREACYRQKYLAEQERPVVRFLQVITELLATEAVRLDPRYGEITADTRAELLGWQDTEHWYLLSGQSYNTVARYCRAEGGHFPLKAGALHKMLFEENAIQNRNGRFTELIRQGDEVHRVLKIGRREVARILALGDA